MNIMNIWVENMKSNRTGESVKNQMLVHVVEEKKSFSVFFSYETKIFTVETDNKTGEKILTLGEKFGYSVTTAKYSKQALEHVLGVPLDKKVLERALKSGSTMLDRSKNPVKVVATKEF